MKLCLRAALKGHVEIVKLCRENGVARNYDGAMYYATFFGHVEIVKLCREWGGRNYNAVM